MKKLVCIFISLTLVLLSSSAFAEGNTWNNDHDLSKYVGFWADVEEPNSTLAIIEQDGSYSLNAFFYRMAAFEASLIGPDEENTCLIFQSDDGLFAGSMYLYSDMISFYVEPADDFAGYFDGREFIYARHEGMNPDEWLGTWISGAGDGESITVTEVNDTGIVLVYHGLTASGESYFDTEYTLAFENPDKTIAAEDESVVMQSGWRRVFILQDGYVTMQSRYPDQNFYKQ